MPTGEPPAGFYGILVLVIVVMAAVGLVTWIFHRRRQDAFRTEAERLGLRYEAHSSEELHRIHRNIPPFKEGRSRPRTMNVVAGIYKGWNVRCCEFLYTVHTGKSSHTVTRSLALAHPAAAWPALSIQPETMGHKILDALGAEDIDFESDEFSRSFWVRAEDRRFAYDVIHPRMMEFLLRTSWRRWHVKGNVVVVWDPRRLRPDRVQGALDELVGFLELVPRYLRPAQASNLGRPESIVSGARL